MNTKFFFFLIINPCALYSMQENVFIKDVFSELEEPQQKLVCNGIKPESTFNIFNNAHAHAKWEEKNNPNAVHMFKIKDDGRVIIFKGSRYSEVLVSAFASLCSME